MFKEMFKEHPACTCRYIGTAKEISSEIHAINNFFTPNSTK